MVEEMNANKLNNLNNGTAASFPPSLSSGLLLYYNSLDSFKRGIFVKVYTFLWGVVNHGRFTLLSSFWALEVVRLRSSLTSSQLAVLTYLYQLSYKGVRFIHSDSIYYGVILGGFIHNSKVTLLNDLKRAGYITRHTSNPDEPYLQRSRSRQPVFIRLTYKGVALIERIEKDMNRLLLDTSFNDLTGVNRKAR